MPDAERTALIRDTWLRNSQEAQRVFLNAEFYRCAVLQPMPLINFREMDEPIVPSAVHYLEFRKEWHRRTVDDYEWRVMCENIEVASGLQHSNINRVDPRAYRNYANQMAAAQQAAYVNTLAGYAGGLAQAQYRGYNDFIHNNVEVEAKSIELLKEWLTPKQLRDFERKDSFTVIGSITSKRYRIERSRTFGVHELSETGATVRRLCFVPTTAYALGDIMLAQKIMLEQREDEALKIANVSPLNESLYTEIARVTRDAMLPRLYERFFGGPTT